MGVVGCTPYAKESQQPVHRVVGRQTSVWAMEKAGAYALASAHHGRGWGAPGEC